MGAMSQAEIVAFYAELHEKRGHKDTLNFCTFLDELFSERDFSGCTFFTSLNTFCIVRFPTYSEWRHKPLLSIRIASSTNVLFELRITEAIKPALRATTRSSSAKYDVAFDEFDRMYNEFMLAHDELEPH